MKLIHNPNKKQINFLDERYYTLDEVIFYPSVTQVLSVYPKGAQFKQWLKDMGNSADEVLRRAADSGSKVHDAINRYLLGEEILWDDSIYTLLEWEQILRFVEFWQEYKPELICTEYNIVSETFELGGTVDLVCRIAGEVWLIDIKTAKAIYKDHELQSAAYAMMWNTEEEIKIDKTAIFWTKALTRGPDSKGIKIQGKKWQLKEFDRHYTEAWKIFKHIHEIYKEENPISKPLNHIYPDRIKLNGELQ